MNNESTNIAGTSTREDRDEHNSFNVKIKSTEMAGEPSGTEDIKWEDIKWLLDSGCSDHIVNSDKYFYKVIDLKNPINIKTLVDEPMDKNVIEVKWIYRIKSDGKYKARVVAKGLISVEKISTEDQTADILTKSLGKCKFQKFRTLLGLENKKIVV
ncbi:hypothetical protein QE152_g36492 [Popillia japonica]|uniref:Uncharacterized protein n=1 Tax=Popillia japonica TaxID=7064 RepID=A0AAW1ICY9_POPJA